MIKRKLISGDKPITNLLPIKITTNIKLVSLSEENIVSIDGNYFGCKKLQSESSVGVFRFGFEFCYNVVTKQVIDSVQLCPHYFLHGPVPYFFEKILVSKVLNNSINSKNFLDLF